jgi:hypothetical protein
MMKHGRVPSLRYVFIFTLWQLNSQRTILQYPFDIRVCEFQSRSGYIQKISLAPPGIKT